MFDFLFSKEDKNSNNKNPNSKISSSCLSDYEIENTIGEGTFGEVKLGIHKPTKKKVAIKVLSNEAIKSDEDKERLEKEISILHNVNHPNIIKIFDIIKDTNSYYIIEEYASSGELFNYIVSKRKLSTKEASFFFVQIIQGVEYLHNIKKIAHRDLKPENLLINGNKIIKIIDFGLSALYETSNKDEMMLLNTACGSPCYAAPEMILGKEYLGEKADIWSLGITLFAMTCGYLPFEHENTQEMYKKIFSGKIEFPSYISKKSKSLIKRMLTLNPNKRISFDEIKQTDFYLLSKEEAFNALELERPSYMITKVFLNYEFYFNSFNYKYIKNKTEYEYDFYRNISIQNKDLNKFIIMFTLLIENICSQSSIKKDYLIKSIQENKFNSATTFLKLITSDFLETININFNTSTQDLRNNVKKKSNSSSKSNISNSFNNKLDFDNITKAIANAVSLNKNSDSNRSNSNYNININCVSNTPIINIRKINLQLDEKNLQIKENKYKVEIIESSSNEDNSSSQSKKEKLNNDESDEECNESEESQDDSNSNEESNLENTTSRIDLDENNLDEYLSNEYRNTENFNNNETSNIEDNFINTEEINLIGKDEYYSTRIDAKTTDSEYDNQIEIKDYKFKLNLKHALHFQQEEENKEEEICSLPIPIYNKAPISERLNYTSKLSLVNNEIVETQSINLNEEMCSNKLFDEELKLTTNNNTISSSSYENNLHSQTKNPHKTKNKIKKQNRNLADNYLLYSNTTMYLFKETLNQNSIINKIKKLLSLSDYELARINRQNSLPKCFVQTKHDDKYYMCDDKNTNNFIEDTYDCYNKLKFSSINNFNSDFINNMTKSICNNRNNSSSKYKNIFRRLLSETNSQNNFSINIVSPKTNTSYSNNLKNLAFNKFNNSKIQHSIGNTKIQCIKNCKMKYSNTNITKFTSSNNNSIASVKSPLTPNNKLPSFNCVSKSKQNTNLKKDFIIKKKNINSENLNSVITNSFLANTEYNKKDMQNPFNTISTKKYSRVTENNLKEDSLINSNLRFNNLISPAYKKLNRKKSLSEEKNKKPFSKRLIINNNNLNINRLDSNILNNSSCNKEYINTNNNSNYNTNRYKTLSKNNILSKIDFSNINTSSNYKIQNKPLNANIQRKLKNQGVNLSISNYNKLLLKSNNNNQLNIYLDSKNSNTPLPLSNKSNLNSNLINYSNLQKSSGNTNNSTKLGSKKNLIKTGIKTPNNNSNNISSIGNLNNPIKQEIEVNTNTLKNNYINHLNTGMTMMKNNNRMNVLSISSNNNTISNTLKNNKNKTTLNQGLKNKKQLDNNSCILSSSIIAINRQNNLTSTNKIACSFNDVFNNPNTNDVNDFFNQKNILTQQKSIKTSSNNYLVDNSSSLNTNTINNTTLNTQDKQISTTNINSLNLFEEKQRNKTNKMSYQFNNNNTQINSYYRKENNNYNRTKTTIGTHHKLQSDDLSARYKHEYLKYNMSDISSYKPFITRSKNFNELGTSSTQFYYSSNFQPFTFYNNIDSKDKQITYVKTKTNHPVNVVNLNKTSTNQACLKKNNIMINTNNTNIETSSTHNNIRNKDNRISLNIKNNNYINIISKKPENNKSLTTLKTNTLFIDKKTNIGTLKRMKKENALSKLAPNISKINSNINFSVNKTVKESTLKIDSQNNYLKDFYHSQIKSTYNNTNNALNTNSLNTETNIFSNNKAKPKNSNFFMKTKNFIQSISNYTTSPKTRDKQCSKLNRTFFQSENNSVSVNYNENAKNRNSITSLNKNYVEINNNTKNNNISLNKNIVSAANTSSNNINRKYSNNALTCPVNTVNTISNTNNENNEEENTLEEKSNDNTGLTLKHIKIPKQKNTIKTTQSVNKKTKLNQNKAFPISPSPELFLNQISPNNKFLKKEESLCLSKNRSTNNWKLSSDINILNTLNKRKKNSFNIEKQIITHSLETCSNLVSERRMVLNTNNTNNNNHTINKDSKEEKQLNSGSSILHSNNKSELYSNSHIIETKENKYCINPNIQILKTYSNNNNQRKEGQDSYSNSKVHFFTNNISKSNKGKDKSRFKKSESKLNSKMIEEENVFCDHEKSNNIKQSNNLNISSSLYSSNKSKNTFPNNKKQSNSKENLTDMSKLLNDSSSNSYNNTFYTFKNKFDSVMKKNQDASDRKHSNLTNTGNESLRHISIIQQTKKSYLNKHIRIKSANMVNTTSLDLSNKNEMMKLPLVNKKHSKCSSNTSDLINKLNNKEIIYFKKLHFKINSDTKQKYITSEIVNKGEIEKDKTNITEEMKNSKTTGSLVKASKFSNHNHSNTVYSNKRNKDDKDNFFLNSHKNLHNHLLVEEYKNRKDYMLIDKGCLIKQSFDFDSKIRNKFISEDYPIISHNNTSELTENGISYFLEHNAYCSVNNIPNIQHNYTMKNINDVGNNIIKNKFSICSSNTTFSNKNTFSGKSNILSINNNCISKNTNNRVNASMSNNNDLNYNYNNVSNNNYKKNNFDNNPSSNSELRDKQPKKIINTKSTQIKTETKTKNASSSIANKYVNQLFNSNITKSKNISKINLKNLNSDKNYIINSNSNNSKTRYSPRNMKPSNSLKQDTNVTAENNQALGSGNTNIPISYKNDSYISNNNIINNNIVVDPENGTVNNNNFQKKINDVISSTVLNNCIASISNVIGNNSACRNNNKALSELNSFVNKNSNTVISNKIAKNNKEEQIYKKIPNNQIPGGKNIMKLGGSTEVFSSNSNLENISGNPNSYKNKKNNGKSFNMFSSSDFNNNNYNTITYPNKQKQESKEINSGKVINLNQSNIGKKDNILTSGSGTSKLNASSSNNIVSSNADNNKNTSSTNHPYVPTNNDKNPREQINYKKITNANKVINLNLSNSKANITNTTNYSNKNQISSNSVNNTFTNFSNNVMNHSSMSNNTSYSNILLSNNSRINKVLQCNSSVNSMINNNTNLNFSSLNNSITSKMNNASLIGTSNNILNNFYNENDNRNNKIKSNNANSGNSGNNSSNIKRSGMHDNNQIASNLFGKKKNEYSTVKKIFADLDSISAVRPNFSNIKQSGHESSNLLNHLKPNSNNTNNTNKPAQLKFNSKTNINNNFGNNNIDSSSNKNSLLNSKNKIVESKQTENTNPLENSINSNSKNKVDDINNLTKSVNFSRSKSPLVSLNQNQKLILIANSNTTHNITNNESTQNNGKEIYVDLFTDDDAQNNSKVINLNDDSFNNTVKNTKNKKLGNIYNPNINIGINKNSHTNININNNELDVINSNNDTTRIKSTKFSPDKPVRQIKKDKVAKNSNNTSTGTNAIFLPVKSISSKNTNKNITENTISSHIPVANFSNQTNIHHHEINLNTSNTNNKHNTTISNASNNAMKKQKTTNNVNLLNSNNIITNNTSISSNSSNFDNLNCINNLTKKQLNLNTSNKLLISNTNNSTFNSKKLSIKNQTKIVELKTPLISSKIKNEKKNFKQQVVSNIKQQTEFIMSCSVKSISSALKKLKSIATEKKLILIEVIPNAKYELIKIRRKNNQSITSLNNISNLEETVEDMKIIIAVENSTDIINLQEINSISKKEESSSVTNKYVFNFSVTVNSVSITKNISLSKDIVKEIVVQIFDL